MSKSRVQKRASPARNTDPQHPLYPQCDGKPWESNGSTDRSAAVRRQFLDAYFRINVAYAKLVALRSKWPSHPPKAKERSALQGIEMALLARAALDDCHASRGLVATPVYRDGFTVNVLFSDALTGPGRGYLVMASSSSVRLTFTLPAGLQPKRPDSCKS
jgi:hypothetical protein